MAKQSAGRVDPALKKAMNDLVKEVTLKKKDEEGQKYSLSDVMKVMNARIKLAAIEAKMVDGEYGTGFGEDNDGTD